MKEKIQLEYSIKASHKSLYTIISTPDGLAKWFADGVEVDKSGHEFTFQWEGDEQSARLIARRDMDLIRFRWNDEDQNEYFEFRIVIDPLTNDMALVITDFSEPDEKEDDEQLWNLQVESLKKSLGAI